MTIGQKVAQIFRLLLQENFGPKNVKIGQPSRTDLHQSSFSFFISLSHKHTHFLSHKNKKWNKLFNFFSLCSLFSLWRFCLSSPSSFEKKCCVLIRTMQPNAYYAFEDFLCLTVGMTHWNEIGNIFICDKCYLFPNGSNPIGLRDKHVNSPT